jgi:hypothetical protein
LQKKICFFYYQPQVIFMNSKHIFFALFLLFFFVEIFAFQLHASDTDLSGNNFGKLTFKQTQGSGFGYQKSYTTLEVFITPRDLQSELVPFIDLRGHRFSNERWAANFGFGLRSFLPSVDAVVGANIYYDYRDTMHKSFQQAGVGLEFLQRNFDVRMNVYLPTNQRSPYFDHTSNSLCDPTFLNFSGNSAIIAGRTTHRSKKYHVTLRGIDAEIGKNFNLGGCFNLYLAAGPYYYSSQKAHNIWGGAFRCAARFTEFLSLEVKATTDKLYHTNVHAQIALTIPLGTQRNESGWSFCWDPQALPIRLTQLVYRNEMIPIKKHTKRKTIHENIPVIDPITGQALNFIFVNNTNPLPGNGTFENPFNTLLGAQNGSKPDDVIYVFAGNGTTSGMDAGITLQTNQQFLGGGLTNTFTSACGPVVVPPQSGMPHITNLTGDAVTLANNDLVRGFAIDAPLGAGISGILINNTSIQDNIITNPGAFGITITDSSGQLDILNNILNTPADVVESIILQNHGTISASTMIVGNTIVTGNEAIEVFTFDSSFIASTIAMNTIVGNFTSFTGIDVDAFNQSTQTTIINQNTISNIAGPGGIGIIVVSTRFSPTPPVTFTFIKSTVTNNIVSGSNANGIVVATGNGGQQCSHVENNTMFNNGAVGFEAETSTPPGGDVLCLRLLNNNSDNGYLLNNIIGVPLVNTFNLEPTVGNVGTITTSGIITPVAAGTCCQQ